jgi:hypothetical protein
VSAFSSQLAKIKLWALAMALVTAARAMVLLTAARAMAWPLGDEAAVEEGLASAARVWP